jgi:hypothetical protein
MYGQLISEFLNGRDYDPRHIEGYMRLQYGTLDHLSREDFKREVEIGVACINQDGAAKSERLAQSIL